MRKIGLVDLVGVIKFYLQSKKTLDKDINSIFKEQFKSDFVLVKQGRTAMQALIEDFNLKGSEIILPSFICSDIFANLFIQNNITPKIVDCRKNRFNVDIRDVKKEITKKTKAILIVHTYGIPNDPRPFKRLCKKRGILLIEDCAHCINLKFKEKCLGSYGDAAIFSFVKEMPNYMGGLYVNNLRGINMEVKEKINPSNLSREDLFLLLDKSSISRLLKEFKRRLFKNKGISNLYKKIELSDMSKLSKAIFCYYINKIDTNKKRELALTLRKKLKDKKKYVFALDENEIKKSSAKCFPFIVKNKVEIIKKMENLGFYPGKGWVPSFSNNILARRKWNLPKTKIAEGYEKNLVNLDLDELDENKIEKLVEIF